MVLIIKETIKYLVEHADRLAQEPLHRRTVTYVKNETFLTGAFRVHKTHFEPAVMTFSAAEINQAIKELNLTDLVEYDELSMWLTIYSV